MRRRDREITDFKEIIKIIDACDILRLGIADGDFPYVVPVNFAYTVKGEQLEFYIHGAMAGKKYELLRKKPMCSFEMDLPLGMDCMADQKDVTMRYQSVMGKATVQFLDGEERQQALDDILMARYEETRDFLYNRSAVSVTAVARLTVTELSAKANLPENREKTPERV